MLRLRFLSIWSVMTIIASNLIAKSSCKIIINNGFLINNLQLFLQLVKEVIEKFINIHLFLSVGDHAPWVLESQAKGPGIMVQSLAVFQSGKYQLGLIQQVISFLVTDNLQLLLWNWNELVFEVVKSEELLEDRVYVAGATQVFKSYEILFYG